MAAETNVLTAQDLFAYWQGYRKLTRRTVETFPDDKLFTFSVGGMRPFSAMAWEFIKMAVPIAKGVATANWEEYSGAAAPATNDSICGR